MGSRRELVCRRSRHRCQMRDATERTTIQVAASAENGQMFLPLPGGEGWGEGGRHLQPVGPDCPGHRRHRGI